MDRNAVRLRRGFGGRPSHGLSDPMPSRMGPVGEEVILDGDAEHPRCPVGSST